MPVIRYRVLRAPFPWFGGKSRVAALVWERFGPVENYVEPFFGSGAVLLGRPSPPGIETVNDRDCLLANFWRAAQKDPEKVARYADHPVNEADLHARHAWLCSREKFRERMKTDPGYCDARIAGWWVWGQCCWIGSGWCERKLPEGAYSGNGREKGMYRKRPDMGVKGVLHPHHPTPRPRPDMGEAKGVRRLNGNGSLAAYFRELAARLRRVRVCCGDWARVCGRVPTTDSGLTGMFLDPPYAGTANRCTTLYASEDLQVSRDVRRWAVEHGRDPRMRIALCGFEGEHRMPEDWDCVPWNTAGGYGVQGDGQARENKRRERIWFSPHCLPPPSRFGMLSVWATSGARPLV